MKIFLAYALEDRDTAEQVHLALVGRMHSVFFDRTTLAGGADYIERIGDAIARSDLMVFLISEDSVRRASYPLTELALAQRKWPHPAEGVLPVMIRATSYDRLPNYLKAVTVFEPPGNVAADVAHEVDRLAAARTRRSRIGRTLSRHRWLAAPGAVALVGAVAVLWALMTSDRSMSADELRVQLAEMRTTLQAMEARSHAVQSQYDALARTLSQLDDERRQQFSATLRANLTATVDNGAPEWSSQARRIVADASLTEQEQDAQLVGIIASVGDLNAEIDQQAERVASQSSSPSLDVETMRLKRQIDKRNQMLDMLRQIIDKYNETAKGIIESMGR